MGMIIHWGMVYQGMMCGADYIQQGDVHMDYNVQGDCVQGVDYALGGGVQGGDVTCGDYVQGVIIHWEMMCMGMTIHRGGGVEGDDYTQGVMCTGMIILPYGGWCTGG